MENFAIGTIIGVMLGNLVLAICGNPLTWISDKLSERRWELRRRDLCNHYIDVGISEKTTREIAGYKGKL